MKFFPDLLPVFKAMLAETSGRRVAVVGHMRPDGDCIGSQAPLCRLLRARGVEAVCVNHDPVPRRLQFLVGDTPFVTDRELAENFDSTGGWSAIFTDCADHARAGDLMLQLFPRPHGNIDHHVSNEGYAVHNIVDPRAAATAEIIAGLFFDAGLPVDPLSAQNLFAGIATDTGQFRFPSTTRRVFQIAGRLIECGADPAAASEHLYERESLEKLELLGRFLKSLQRACDGRLCMGFLTNADFSETGAGREDTEGLVDYARAIDGVEIGMLVEERSDGIKTSLRAKDPVMRVDQVAALFGGGGHACAAGLSASGGLDVFTSRIVSAIGERLRTVDALRSES